MDTINTGGGVGGEESKWDGPVRRYATWFIDSPDRKPQ